MQDDRRRMANQHLCDLNGCVEVALLDARWRSATPRTGPAPSCCSAREWEAFVGGVRGGEFDPR